MLYTTHTDKIMRLLERSTIKLELACGRAHSRHQVMIDLACG